MTIDPQELRETLMSNGLSRDELADDPLQQFQDWYQLAIETGLPEPNAMSLCTIGAGAQPSLRTVLLKLYDARGFVFFTNYTSRKAREIADNPQVSALFPWVALARQIEIGGRAERISSAESLKYFVTRGRGSRIGAWASPQSQVIRSRAVLEGKVAEMRRRFGNGEIPLPDDWGGIRIVPSYIEFWQGRDCRLHDRFRYVRSTDGDSEGHAGGGWRIERLAP